MSAATAGRLTLTVALSLWVAWNAPEHLTGALRGDGTHGGYGFHYRDSEIMRFLRDNPSDTDLYSNAPYASYSSGSPGSGLYLYLPANRQYARAAGDSDPRDLLNLFLERAGHGDRVVWMFGGGDNHLFDYDAADMRAHAGLRLVADLADGAVFEVNRTFDRETNDRILAALATEPDVRAVFDIRIRDNRLIYSRTPCARTDIRDRFFVHVFPADDSNLPDDRKRYGFLGLDFDFNRLGGWLDETCAAMVALPEPRIARVVTGQFTGRNRLWEVEIPIGDGETGRAPVSHPVHPVIEGQQ